MPTDQKNKACILCGCGPVVHEERDLLREYKGISTIFPKVKGTFCDSCGEAIFDFQEGSYYSDLLGAFMREIDSKIKSS